MTDTITARQSLDQWQHIYDTNAITLRGVLLDNYDPRDLVLIFRIVNMIYNTRRYTKDESIESAYISMLDLSKSFPTLGVQETINYVREAELRGSIKVEPTTIGAEHIIPHNFFTLSVPGIR